MAILNRTIKPDGSVGEGSSLGGVWVHLGARAGAYCSYWELEGGIAFLRYGLEGPGSASKNLALEVFSRMAAQEEMRLQRQQRR